MPNQAQRQTAEAGNASGVRSSLGSRSDSLQERGESRSPHPFRDFSRYETENQWRRYFLTAAKRRYIRNLKTRDRAAGVDVGLVEAAEAPGIQLAVQERIWAVEEIDNLPDTFTEAQKEILRYILQGHLIDQAPQYSEGYIRKVIRKAIAYFQNRE